MTASLAILAWNKKAPQFLKPDFLSPGPVSVNDLLEIDRRFVGGLPMFNPVAPHPNR